MLRQRLTATSLTSLGVALLPLAANAAVFNSIGDVVSKACQVVNYLYTGAIILTIVFVLLAAIKYITRGSDPKNVSDAHQQLLWAAIGFGIAVASAVIPKVIAAILGANATPSACG